MNGFYLLICLLVNCQLKCLFRGKNSCINALDLNLQTMKVIWQSRLLPLGPCDTLIEAGRVRIVPPLSFITIIPTHLTTLHLSRALLSVRCYPHSARKQNQALAHTSCRYTAMESCWMRYPGFSGISHEIPTNKHVLFQ